MDKVLIDIREESKQIQRIFKDKDIISVEDLIAKIEELDDEVSDKEDKIRDLEQDIQDNYKPIRKEEQYI